MSSSSASVEIPHILWNLKVHYHVHQNPPFAYTITQTIYVHDLSFYSHKIHFNIILPSTRKFSKYLFSYGFLSRIMSKFIFFPIRASCTAHLIPVDLIP